MKCIKFIEELKHNMGRTEIGSEFWDIPLADENHLFPDCTKWFISGRSALRAILSENTFETASIPVWCCDSMIKPFLDAGIKVSFYSNEPEPSDAVLVMDYFGYASDRDYRDYPGVVIRDLTHSLFSKDYRDADYYFGSLRKWAGFWTGGFAWGFCKNVSYSEENPAYAKLRDKAMTMKAAYIAGNTKSKEYLRAFGEAEDMLDDVGILPANDRDIQAARCLDAPTIRNQRRKNAKILLDALKPYAIYPEIRESDCPMFVPIRIGDRDGLRRHLIQHEIYCPVHWPVSDLHHLDDASEELYSQELSLVCDQRYTEADMERIVDTINRYLSGRT